MPETHSIGGQSNKGRAMDWEMVISCRLAGYAAGAVVMIIVVAVRVARDSVARFGLRSIFLLNR
jgi:hypothetical protein